jgi:arsenate reductase (thioredoxin)
MNLKKIGVLFICKHNSARSQIAEAFLNQMAGEYFEAESAGVEVGELNPLAIDVMMEVGIDISGNKTKEVFDLYRRGRFYSYIIKVCDKVTAERCPIFPGMVKRLEWSFTDPASLEGSYEDRLIATRCIRDQIRAAISDFIKSQKMVP